MIQLLPTLALLLQTAIGTQQVAPRVKALVEVDAGAAGLDRSALRARGFDVVYGDDGTLHVLADTGEQERLATSDIPFTVLHEDLTRFYVERNQGLPLAGPPTLGAWLSPVFGDGSLIGFYTFDEVVSVLDQITAAYPAITTDRFSVGQTIEGRDIWAVKVSDNPDADEAEPEVRFDAMHHAREPEGMQATLWTLLWLLENYGTDPLATYLVNEREIWFLPVVNPDGYIYNEVNSPAGGGLWRKNRRDNADGTFGVDLNRNYSYEWGFDDLGSDPFPSSTTYRGPSPASEPETMAMEAFLSSREFVTALSTHCYSNVWIHPWGYIDTPPAGTAAVFQELSALATEVNGYPYGTVVQTLNYPANGGTFDYDHGVHGTFGWTPEIGSSSDGFWPQQDRIVPLAEENRVGFLRTAWAAGTYVRLLAITLDEIGDGDGSFEPGESLELVVDVRNSGFQSAASVQLSVTSASGDVVPSVGNVALGTVASFTSASNAATPLALDILPTAATGASVDLTISFTYQGLTQSATETLLVGEVRTILTDDLELDLGWIAGDPGDTATTGLWEFGDPVGTSSSSQPANPEDDVTPDPGVNCYATGNGSTSGGGDDIDDGSVTLVSPALDLSGVSSAILTYHRWFADLTEVDDLFEVWISDDDGASWVPVETVAVNANSWTEVSIDVTDFVSLTDEVRLRFRATDDPNNSVCEAGVDELRVQTFEEGTLLSVYGRPQIGNQLAFHVAGEANSLYVVLGSPGQGSIMIPGLDGPFLLDPGSFFILQGGAIPANGLRRTLVNLPNNANLVGRTYFLQAIAGSSPQTSNLVDLTIE